MSAPQGDHSPVTNTMVDEASQNLVSQPSDAFIGILIMGCRTFTFRLQSYGDLNFCHRLGATIFPALQKAALSDDAVHKECARAVR